MNAYPAKISFDGHQRTPFYGKKSTISNKDGSATEAVFKSGIISEVNSVGILKKERLFVDF